MVIWQQEGHAIRNGTVSSEERSQTTVTKVPRGTMLNTRNSKLHASGSGKNNG